MSIVAGEECKKSLFLKHPDPRNLPELKNDDLPPHLHLKHPAPPPLVERCDYSGDNSDEDLCSDRNDDENNLRVHVSKTRLRHSEKK